MFARILLVCVALCALTFASPADEPKEVKETKLKPTFVFSGSHSAIDREMFAVVTDEAAWKALWEKHRGGKKTLQFTEREQHFDIDFDTQYAIAIFPAQYDWCFVTQRKRGEEVVIGFRAHGFSTEGRAPGAVDTRTEHEKAKENVVTPYAFVVLPKPVSIVVIEKDVRQDKFGTPEWKELKRFPAPKDKK